MAKAQTDAGWPAMARMFRAFCLGMDTPRSLKAWLLVKNGEFQQLAEMKIHPREYLTADAFSVDYGVVSFLKKNKDLPWKTDTRTPAIAAFASSEVLCKETNEVFENWMNGKLCASRSVVEVLHLAQRKISDLLGTTSFFTEGPYSWGPGSTYDIVKKRAYPDTKLVELPFTVTGSAWKHACRAIAADLHWKEAITRHNPSYDGPIFRIIPGGRYDTVDKTVLTDRSILVEARLNTFLQKRCGTQIRRLLKRVGVDLEDQSTNQYLAEHARVMDLATLDLEAASDSVARKVVEFFLPPEWFDLLDDLRAKWVQIDEDWVRLEKFSSMGNGFTFELESLIFWAITSAASELSYRTTIGVYGDDIICHRDALPKLKEALSFCGFRLNASKSFEEGEFFESCGKHYFGGIDVTPLYQKSVPRDGAQAARLSNRLLRYSARLGLHVTFDKRVRGAWESWIRDWRPKGDQFGPYLGHGDGYWESPDYQLLNRSGSAVMRSVAIVVCYSPSPREIPAYEEAMYALWLQQTAGRSFGLPKLVADWPEPLVSVTGTSRRRAITHLLVASDKLDSRLKPRVYKQHRRVQLGPWSTTLTW